MSYTAPTYVDTKAQAILALASTIADEDKTLLGDGSVNKALDVLADVLAEQDVQVPQTDAGAILALAQYVNGGGGGGGTKHSITCKIFDMETLETSDMPTTIGEAVMGDEGWDKDPAMTYIAEASCGTILACDQYNVDGGESYLPFAFGTANPDAPNPLGADIVSGDNGFGYFFPMPAYDTIVFYTAIE